MEPGRRHEEPRRDLTGAKRLKELEIEYARLKRLGTEKELGIAILRGAIDYLGEPQAARAVGLS